MTQKQEKNDILDGYVAYRNIMTWLYLNDGNFEDKLKWRKEFVDMLKSELKLGRPVVFQRMSGTVVGGDYLE